MTERIRALLDEAVADVRPRDPDPVPEVLRRGRARRRHLSAAGAAAAVVTGVLATVGIVATNRPAPDVTPGPRPSASAGRGQGPARVDAEIVDGTVRIGGLSIPMPRGWQVIRDTRMDYCAVPANSVLVNVMEVPGGNCDLHPQMAVRVWEPHAYPKQAASLGTMSEVVLPGGQPVWLDANELDYMRSVRRSAEDGFSAAQPVLPWADVQLVVDGQQAQIDAVLEGIRSDPVAPARLALPDGPAAVQLNVGERQLSSTDPAVIGQLLALLGELDRPVTATELPCPGAERVTDTWRLAGTAMAGLTFSDPPVMIAISTDDECAFATSSRGGRVHLPAGFLGRVQQLLGGRR